MSQVFTVGGTAYTAVLDKLSPEIGGKAAYGERSVGKAVLYDDTNVIDDDNAVKVWKQYTWVETATSPDTTLSAGRVTGFATHRGDSDEDSVANNAVQWDLQLEDANAELQKLACAPSIGPCNAAGEYVRPAETDVERVQAVLADWLSGDPRATTVISDTYVADANTVDMEAKRYPPGTTPADILMECATAADKWFFVTADMELFYDIPNTEAYDAALEISDGVGSHPDPDFSTYWPPIWDMGPALDYQGQEFATAIVGVYGQNQAVYEEDASNIAAFDYLAETVNLDAETSGQATHDVHGLLRIRGRGQRSYQMTLRLRNTQVDKIKYGQRVRCHLSAAVDMDDTPQYRRVAELKWQPVADGTWYDAHITLERMPRLFPGNINGGPIIPKPPVQPTGGSGDSELICATFDGANADPPVSDVVPSGLLYTTEINANWPPGALRLNTDHGGCVAVGLGTTDAGSPLLNATAGETYTFDFDYWNGFWGFAVIVDWFAASDTNTPIQADTLVSSPVSDWAHRNVSFTAPATTAAMRITFEGSGRYDNFCITQVGTAGTTGGPIPTLGGPGEGSPGTSGTYTPGDAVIEHGDLSGKGGIMHDATQIEVIDTAGNFDSTTVEGALSELFDDIGTPYNDEQAQDAVGGILTDSSTIDFTYNDATPSIAAAVIPSGIKLDDLGTPDDNTDLDASTSRHGLLKKLPGGTTTFLRADGTFATPSTVAALDDLSDVTITSPATADRLRYNGSQWVNSSLKYSPTTTFDGTNWLLVTDGSGNPVLTEV